MIERSSTVFIKCTLFTLWMTFAAVFFGNIVHRTRLILLEIYLPFNGYHIQLPPCAFAAPSTG